MYIIGTDDTALFERYGSKKQTVLIRGIRAQKEEQNEQSIIWKSNFRIVEGRS